MDSTSKRALLFAGALCAFVALPASAQRDQRVTPNDVAKKKGYKLEGLMNVDIDGDGKPESVAACRGDKGLRVCVFGENDKGATWGGEAPWARGKRFKKLEAQELVGSLPGVELVFELYDETPDEKVKRIRVYTGTPKLREIFSSVIYRPKNKSMLPKWEAKDVVKYGDARGGWYFLDLDEDGNKEAIVRRKPRVVSVPTSEDAQKILIGVEEDVFRFDPKAKKYKPTQGRYSDFAAAYPIKTVTASSAFIPKETLEDMQAEAISTQMAAASEGKAAAEVKLDRSAFMLAAADKDLDTGWLEDAKGPGEGEWVEVELEEEQTIHMVRVVAGCTESKRSFMGHNIPTKFELRFDGGEKSMVDLYNIAKPDRPGVGTLMRPIKSKGFAKQTLVFFNGKFTAKKVRLVISGTKRLGRGNHTCVSEISVH